MTYRRNDISKATLRLVHEAKKLAGAKDGTATILSKEEFNIRFLLTTQPYIPKVALALLRECREDIELFGLEYAQKKWAKFIGCRW